MEALLMLKVKTVLLFGKVLLGGLLVVSLAGPAFAGNVWSWQTEDGAYAFTDDPKRIPAKHRAEAQKKTMGKLTRYERFTNVSVETEKPYTERIRERQSELRGMTAAAPQGAVVGAVGSSAPDVMYGIPASGRDGRSGSSLMLPLVGGQVTPDSAPTVVSDIRVKPRRSMATRHFTVIQKGDQIVSVIKAELNQRPLKARPESDFDL
jgi:hypothetical protein